MDFVTCQQDIEWHHLYLIMKMMDELVSVLMPLYRGNVSWLRESIESILSQTYRNIELLVLFEGEKEDECCSYLKSVEDSRLKVIDVPMGTGLPKTLNIGIRSANGKYIARMDADDISHKSRIEKQVSFLERNTDVAVLGTAIRILGTDNKDFEKGFVTPEIRKIRLLFGNAGIAHPTAMIRRDFLLSHSIGYNEEIGGSEDYHLWTDIVLNGGNIDQLAEPLLDYRISDMQATQRLSEKEKEWNWQAKRKMLLSLGKFSQNEKNLMKTWDEIEPEAKPDRYIKFFKKIIRFNEQKHIFDENYLRKELAYRYFLKGYIACRHSGNREMLSIKNLSRMVKPKDIPYICRTLGGVFVRSFRSLCPYIMRRNM